MAPRTPARLLGLGLLAVGPALLQPGPGHAADATAQAEQVTAPTEHAPAQADEPPTQPEQPPTQPKDPPAAPPLTVPELSPTPTDLLAGRLRARFPKGARVEARPHNIMAAPAAAATETRVVYDQGPHRVVVMAEELLATVTDVAAVARDWYDAETFDLETARLDAMEAAFFAPKRLDTSKQAVLVRGALLRHPADDGALVVRVYVYPATAKADADAARETADRILRSLRAGARALELQARTVALQDLTLDLPEGWVLVHQPGPDFSVYWVSRLEPVGTSTGTLGIYIGGHPKPLPAGEGVTQTAGRLLGREVSWHTQTAQEGRAPEVVSEAQVRHPARGEMMLHVWATAPTAEAGQAFRDIAGTLAVKR